MTVTSVAARRTARFRAQALKWKRVLLTEEIRLIRALERTQKKAGCYAVMRAFSSYLRKTFGRTVR